MNLLTETDSPTTPGTGKHLLVDVDSKIPNLALLKISAYLKAKGARDEDVTLFEMKGKMRLLPYKDWSSIWISCVFKWHSEIATTVWQNFVEAGFQAQMGGSGVDVKRKLPAEIEMLAPDYSLYDDDRAIGFVQRGCIRKCQFCIVPEKEGRLVDNPYRPLDTWVPDGFDKILLLDNEFAGLPYDEKEREEFKQRDWFFETTQQEIMNTVKENGWKLSITQGYDIRCMTPEKAAMLADCKPYGLKFTERRLYIAWDYFWIEPYVHKGIQMLLDAGFKGREIMCYCLVGYENDHYRTTHAQDFYRFRTLWKKYGVLPFIMRFNMRKDDKFLNSFARYVNRGPASYRNHSFTDYCAERAPKLLEEAMMVENA